VQQKITAFGLVGVKTNFIEGKVAKAKVRAHRIHGDVDGKLQFYVIICKPHLVQGTRGKGVETRENRARANFVHTPRELIGNDTPR